ncbi:carbon monoxide dehydrogenase [Streptomyces sp. SID10853]|uniref:SRPBCC domain-containing protein n=1 Tax=Streptomyces sp. SID10853 TaxID=2706028 RepID=UPI0013C01E21|nr:SRPBCC domain-containing protein [Streptomyces sp. SID10853]NDZ77772.1 carbon monoxide dehydrogenase [Streptomyces sp. SID10853]
MISITEEILVPSPPGRVWEVISDPSAVVSCIGGAELGPSHDDGSFDGTLAIRFGGLRVKFAARVSLDLDESAHEGRLTARGADGQRATRFSAGATFRVVEGDTPGGSRVFCDGEIKLNGKLAKLIESGAGMVVSRMTKEFTEQLVQKCAEPAGPRLAASAQPDVPLVAASAEAPTAVSPAPAEAASAEPLSAASTAAASTGPASTGPASTGVTTAPPRPAGLFARLRAWWTGRRSGRPGQPPQATRPAAENTSGEALGQGGRR